MRYQYSRLHADTHRDVAHWRGARGGIRVLSLPTCASWLQRQANDDFYDFWPDLAIGSALPAQHPVAPTATAPGTFILHKNADGAWFINPWQGDPFDDVRPRAANGVQRGGALAAVSRDPSHRGDQKALNVLPKMAFTVATGGGAGERPMQLPQEDQAGPTSFIIELGNKS